MSLFLPSSVRTALSAFYIDHHYVLALALCLIQPVLSDPSTNSTTLSALSIPPTQYWYVLESSANLFARYE